VDDERLDLIWEKAGELKIPDIIHTADPKPFWQLMDENNERWLELATHPGRKRGNTNPAPWDTLIAEQHRMFKKHRVQLLLLLILTGTPTILQNWGSTVWPTIFY
jgi:uncharacterized protein